jgi:hypothetical protein
MEGRAFETRLLSRLCLIAARRKPEQVAVSVHSGKAHAAERYQVQVFRERKLEQEKDESKRKTSLVIVNSISCAAKKK